MYGILIILKAKLYKIAFSLFYGRIVEEVVSESEPHEETVIRFGKEYTVMARDVVIDVYSTFCPGVKKRSDFIYRYSTTPLRYSC